MSVVIRTKRLKKTQVRNSKVQKRTVKDISIGFHGTISED